MSDTIHPPVPGLGLSWEAKIAALLALWRQGDLELVECGPCRGTGYVPGYPEPDECDDCGAIGLYLRVSPDVALELRHVMEPEAEA